MSLQSRSVLTGFSGYATRGCVQFSRAGSELLCVFRTVFADARNHPAKALITIPLGKCYSNLVLKTFYTSALQTAKMEVIVLMLIVVALAA